MNIVREYLRISRSLDPSVKSKILRASPLFSQLVPHSHTEPAVRRSAQNSLRTHFPFASPQQVDLLTFYLACRVLAMDNNEDSSKDKLDSLGDFDEALAIKLQRLLARQTELLRMLSNLLKKTSDTSDGIISNLK